MRLNPTGGAAVKSKKIIAFLMTIHSHGHISKLEEVNYLFCLIQIAVCHS